MRRVGITSNPAQAGIWSANPDRNVTSAGGTPFIVSSTGAAQQVYDMVPPSAAYERLVAQLRPDNLFAGFSTNRRYFGVDNTTLRLQFYGASTNIYPTDATGPIVMKGVPPPAAGAAIVPPPAAAKPIALRAADVAANGAYRTQYFTTVNEAGSGGITLYRPFTANSVSEASTGRLYSMWYATGATIGVGCVVDAASKVACNLPYPAQYLLVGNDANFPAQYQRLFIANDTASIGATQLGPLVIEAVART
ncbi:hypothetical protein ABW20_dc0109425 [Dactylellina cionopaga]|nr:hypothetical protein ABW20_dc0109425 [Dactylellina cionopaga]